MTNTPELFDIFVDEDDVLAEFYGTADAILGAPFQSLSPAARWGRLEKVPNLFLHLPVREGALELWKGLQGRGRLHVLTAAPRPTGLLHTAPADKEAWIRRHICATTPVLVAESGLHKTRWAHPRAILIDNLGRNTDAFIAAGGLAIVHTSTPDTLRQLAAIAPVIT